jgi:hypothetical protein
MLLVCLFCSLLHVFSSCVADVRVKLSLLVCCQRYVAGVSIKLLLVYLMILTLMKVLHWVVVHISG